MSADSVETDLLGEPVREPEERRGRPAFEVDEEKRNKVSVLRSAGFEIREIAQVLDVSEKTLRKYFFRELELGALLKRAEVTMRMHELGMSGSVPALRRFSEMLEQGQALPPPNPHDAGNEPSSAPKGKKEQAIEDAHTAHKDTGWATVLQ